MKRLIVSLLIMFAGVFLYSNVCFSDIETNFDFLEPVTKVYVYNENMGLIRFATNEQEIPEYMKRQMDLLCEIDGIKYYLID
jgi:predicted small integral membrane protein